jgi:FMN phosphatase YigB (HAD superfamily)
LRLKAVLFDLDGTLLDIDLSTFLPTYFDRLGPVVASVTGRSAEFGLSAVLASTQAMMEPHPGSTNADAFWTSFARITGTELGPPVWAEFDRFYAEEFPLLRADHRPRRGAHELVGAVQGLGLISAVATNPIFPLAAIRERIRWAGLEGARFDAVTSYEVMTACKPQSAYFEETAGMLGVSVSDCLMVGDDRSLDMAAANVGMRTFYCGPDDDASADFSGDLPALVELLPRLMQR